MGWLEHCQSDRAENGTRHKKGLPTCVKHMVDALASGTTKGPKEVLRKVEQMFRMDPFFTNTEVRTCLLKKIKTQVLCVQKHLRDRMIQR